MSLWKKISFGVLIVLVFLLGIVGFLVGIIIGLYLVFKVVDCWVLGLEIGKVIGGWCDLIFDNVCYEQFGVVVIVGQFYFSVRLCCLWDSSLCVNDIVLCDIYVVVDIKKMLFLVLVEEEDSGLLNFFIFYLIIFSCVVLYNVNVKIDDIVVFVCDFFIGLNWQEKNLILMLILLQGLLIVLFKVVKVVQEQVVELKIDNLQLQEKLFGEMMIDFFLQLVLLVMIDVYLLLNFNIQVFCGEQLCLIGDIDIIVYNLLLKVSSIDGQMKFDVFDIDFDQGKVSVLGSVQLQDNWLVDIIFVGILNVDLMKGEKVQLKVGGEVCKMFKVGVDLSGLVVVMLCVDVQLVEVGLLFNMELKSKQFVWLFSGEKQFQVDDVQLKFSGKMIDYVLVFFIVVKG